jgi:hypothetical protein
LGARRGTDPGAILVIALAQAGDGIFGPAGQVDQGFQLVRPGELFQKRRDAVTQRSVGGGAGLGVPGGQAPRAFVLHQAGGQGQRMGQRQICGMVGQRAQQARPHQRRILVTPDGQPRIRAGGTQPRHQFRPAQGMGIEPVGQRLLPLGHAAGGQRGQKGSHVADRQMEFDLFALKQRGQPARPRRRRRIDLSRRHRVTRKGEEPFE